jgi:hypothetical protein
MQPMNDVARASTPESFFGVGAGGSGAAVAAGISGGRPGAAGGVPNFVNPFDPAYGNMALGQVDAAEAAMLRPESHTLPAMPDAPAMPTPQAVPRTDFTAADQALEAMRPVEMTEQQKLRTQRSGWMRGLGQALMQMPGNAGLGQVLAMAGGGALAGRGAADAEIEARMERFEARMAQFNAAVYGHETNKAQVAGREAQAEVQQLNQHAYNSWTVQYQRWQQQNSVNVGEGGVTVQRMGTDGRPTVTRIPFQGAVRGAMALQRASILSQMGGQFNSANGMVAGATNSYIAMQAAAAQSAGQQGGPEAMIAAPAFMAAQAVRYGRVEEAMGSTQEYGALRADVNGRLARSGWPEPRPGDDAYARRYQEHFDELMVEMLTRGALQDPNFARRLFSAGGGGAAITQSERIMGRRERQAVDSRGRRSSSVTYDDNND